MLFARETSLVLVSFQVLGTAMGQGSPAWFPRIQENFSNSSFPLRRCFLRMNEAPTSGSRCGPKSKTCFFGDQVCGNGEAYPAESCICNGTNPNDLGIWSCQPEACPDQGCQDAMYTEEPWFDTGYDGCEDYRDFGYCPRYGGDTNVSMFGLVANTTCCTCGGGVVDPVTQVCSDILVPVDPPLPWTDSVGGNCSWYDESPQTRCVDFANEASSLLNMTVVEACCSCASIVPPANPSCVDLPEWTTASNKTCGEVTRQDCMEDHESFGYSVSEACCKCGARATNPRAPTEFVRRTEPFKAGGCTADSSNFDICTTVAPNVLPEDVEVISASRQRWSTVIVGDSPDFPYDKNILSTTGFRPSSAPENMTDLPAFYEGICGYKPGFPANSTDDVNVCVNQEVLRPGVLAQAAVVFGDNFTRFGLVSINANEVRSMRNNASVLADTMVHELGHVLGIGTLWESSAPNQLNVNETTCEYLGENANRVYQEISGCSANATLPLEDPIEFLFILPTQNISFLICGTHLNEECFINELMTSSANGNSSSPLSSVTVAMLDDLGYSVDYNQADAFTKDDLSSSCVCSDNAIAGDPVTRKLKGKEIEDSPSGKIPLSSEGRADVTTYAKGELKKMNTKAMSYMMNNQDGEEDIGVGIPGLTVMYLEGDTIHTVYVTNGEDDEYEGAEEYDGDTLIEKN